MRLFILLATLLTPACAYAPPIESKTLNSPNPTSYVFSAPFPAVLAIIDELCNKERSVSNADTPTSKAIYLCHRPSEGSAYRRANPLGQSSYPIYTPNYNPNADKDRVAVDTRSFDSRSYYVHEKPLRTRGSFFIDIERISAHETKASVTTINLRALNGTITGIHGAIVPHIADLKPTSIEEYETLLYLANRLGQANMPPLKLP